MSHLCAKCGAPIDYMQECWRDPAPAAANAMGTARTRPYHANCAPPMPAAVFPWPQDQKFADLERRVAELERMIRVAVVHVDPD